MALTKGFTSPPVPNGPASAFEGTGGSLAGAFLHKQFMQGRPISGRQATTHRKQKSPSVTPLPRTGPLFQFRFPKKSGPPHFQNSVKASACCLIYSGLSSTLQSAVAQRRREATVYLRGNAEVLELD